LNKQTFDGRLGRLATGSAGERLGEAADEGEMPRQVRLDVPGTLHDVMARGIEKRKMVDDERDPQAFVGRLGEVAGATGTGFCGGRKKDTSGRSSFADPVGVSLRVLRKNARRGG
jgi:hypothetical protein